MSTRDPFISVWGRLAIDSFNDPETYKFELGKGITLHEGGDVAVIATGLVVNEALKAVRELESEGINARLINIHTIKPIDEEIIIKRAKETGRIITVEGTQCNRRFGRRCMLCCKPKLSRKKLPKSAFRINSVTAVPLLNFLINLGLLNPHIAKGYQRRL